MVALYTTAAAEDDSLIAVDLSSDEQGDLVRFLESLSGPVPRITAPIYKDSVPALPAQATYGVGTIATFSSPLNLTGVSLKFDSKGRIVVLDASGRTLWAMETATTECDATCNLKLESDGNLVIRKGSTIVWQTGTQASDVKATKLFVTQTEPYLRLLSADGSIIWSLSLIHI